MRLVVFHRKDIVTLARNDLFGDLPLTAHGVDRDQSAVQIEQFQQPWNRRDFVGFLIDGHLAEAEMDLAGPGADDMEGSPTFGCVPGVTESLAVDGNVSQTQRARQGLDPVAEASLEGLGIKTVKDAFKGVVGGDAVGQSKEGL